MKRCSMIRFHPVACVFAVLCGLFVFASELRAQSEITIQDIRRAWTERQEKIRTAKFTWKAQRGVRQIGNLNEPAEQTKGLPPLQGTEIPEVTLVFGSQAGQVRFKNEDLGSRVDGASPKPRLGAFDGVEGTSYWHHSDMKYAYGYIYNEWDDRELFYLIPLQLVCRPMDEHLRKVDFDVLSLQPGRVLVDGRKCLLLSEEGRRFPNISTEIYVDVERDFIPLRFISRVRGNLSVQADIRYSQHADGLWLPQSWQATFFGGNGQIVESTTDTVVVREINRPVADDQFRIAFPPLTRIVDKTTDTASDRQPNLYFFVMPDGTRRPVSSLGNDDLEALLEARPPGWYRSWLIAVNSLILTALIGYWLFRRVRTKA